MSGARLVLVSMALALASSARAQVVDPPALGPGPELGCAAAVHGLERPRPRPEGLGAIAGRALASIEGDACVSRLEALGVAFEPLAEAPGVRAPIRLEGPIAGITIEGHVEVLDCRLALALAAWAPSLRAHGVRTLRAMSIHRPGARVAGSRRVSGHAHALAIDVGAIELDDGTAIDVLEGWESRERGADPCGEHAEGARSARLRSAVCAAVRRELFQIVLTPHHDRAHRNHVHLELVPDVAWSYVH